MKKFKRLFAGLLTAILLLSVTGCSGDTTWVFKTENDTVPAGVYLAYMMDAYNQAKNQVDSNTDLWSQKIDDLSVEQWIINKTTKTTKQYVAVNIMFDELGMTMGTEGTNTVKKKADTYWAQYQKNYEKNGISFASVTKVAESEYKTQKVFDYFYEANGKEPVSEETLKEYFYANYAKVKYVGINRYNVKTGEKKDEAELKKAVEDYVTQINKGTDIDEIIDAYATQLYKDYGVANYKVDTTNARRNVALLSKQQTGPVKGFVKKTFEQTEYGIPYTDDSSSSYIYLGARYDLKKDIALYTENRAAVLQELRGGDFTQKIEDRLSTVEITVNEEAINRYSPKNIK